MPGYAYGLPISACPTGSKLRNIEGSACSKCYAARGHYTLANVASAQQRRLAAVSHPQWAEAMAYLIGALTPMGSPYFRWFDSGDVQSYTMLRNILEIAQELPHIAFWLPTQEYKLVSKLVSIPKNLMIRRSSRMIGVVSMESSIAPRSDKARWSELVASNSKDLWHCPSKLQGNKCGECRACWSKEVKHVRYLAH